jgi:hypothetical protein
MERKMAVREFKESSGREWRAWNVAPEELSARTKDEDYLASLYHTGWIVFETTKGDEKRRLYPVPDGWGELPEPELEVLLHKAEVVPPRKLKIERGATGESAAQTIQRAKDFTERAVESPETVRDVPKAETPDVTDLGVVRSFRYPGGRVWSVSVAVPPDGKAPPVLRFIGGDRHIDLREWPADWVDYPNAELVKLLRRAAPRGTSTRRGADTQNRRWDDQQAR